MARLMQARFRQMQQDRLRPGRGDGSSFDTGELLGGLGRIYGGGASLALTGQANPLDALRGIIGGTRQAKQNAMTGQGSPIETGMSLIPMRGSLQGRGAGNLGHGAEVRAELLAKRKAKGPRKAGSGRKPASRPAPAPVEQTEDLMRALAMSVAAPAETRKGGLSALLNRLGRRGGR
jgi:hypothetical protein